MVLKGHRTLVVQPDGEAWVNTTGNPGMATGGTGDILTGIVAGMIAQHHKDRRPFQGHFGGGNLHGLAGDVMREKMGEHSLVATDLLFGLPDAFRRNAQAAQNKLVAMLGIVRETPTVLRDINRLVNASDVLDCACRYGRPNPLSRAGIRPLGFRNLLPVPMAWHSEPTL